MYSFMCTLVCHAFRITSRVIQSKVNIEAREFRSIVQMHIYLDLHNCLKEIHFRFKWFHAHNRNSLSLVYQRYIALKLISLMLLI